MKHTMNWTGVLPAITTNMRADGAIDHHALAGHCRWMIDSGCAAIVCCGSLGEAATLRDAEKIAVARTCVRAIGKRAPVVLGISALGTREAVALARAAKRAGCSGLMVLPPYVYNADPRETLAHASAVIGATDLSCMLYNNPIAYGADFLPTHVAALAAAHPNLHAVKESCGDARRIAALRRRLRGRLVLLVGMDDAVLDGVAAGATGWVAGLVNAFPVESVALFDAAIRGERTRAAQLFRWFLPLLRLDTVPKFVQLIKWVQAELGRGTKTVRPPRLALDAREVGMARRVLERAQRKRPPIAAAS
jgi:dihydrodipicolinate synthase/N-acetylneuraminate lyase